VQQSTKSTNLAEILERVLDKGLVVAGDISVSLAGVELLSIKIRLLIASVDKAREIGINWWENDPYLNAKAKADQDKREEALLAEKASIQGNNRQPVR
jgi:hypothetical protein